MLGHDVTAIILAAGVARRLAPLTDHTQKSLLPVGGRAILAWMLEALHAVAVAALTVYDMVKAADKTMTITDIRLVKKTGGKSGAYIRR